MTNKVTSQSDLNTIKSYIKNVDIINLKNIMISYLPQSKSYFKIIGISYIIEGTNILINSSIVKSIIKSIYIFNDICFLSKSHIIKASSKSDMTIIWVDIWDVQSGTKAKYLINKCFNVGNYITTV